MIINNSEECGAKPLISFLSGDKERGYNECLV